MEKYVWFFAISKKDYIWKLFINISIILFYRSIKAIVILGIFSLFFLFIIIPFFFRWCSTLQRHMVFLPYGKIIRGHMFTKLLIITIFSLDFHATKIHWLHIFLVHWPKHINFSDPESEGLSGTINFYLETSPKVKVGVWHILPKSLVIGSEGKDK